MFSWLYDVLNGVLTGLGKDAVNDVVSALQTIFVMILTIKTLYFGYMTYAGKTQEPLKDFLWEYARLVLIIMFVTNADGYLTLVDESFREIKQVMGGGNISIYAKLDEFLVNLSDLAIVAREKEDSFWSPNISGALASILVHIGGYLAVLPIGFTALLTEITLQILLVSAPIFIFCLMYGFLKNMFAQWLQLIFANILVVFFLSILITFATDLINKQILSMKDALNNSATGAIAIGFAMIGIGVFIFLLTKIVVGIAQSIASVSIEQSMKSVGVSSGASALGASKSVGGSAVSGAYGASKYAGASAYHGIKKLLSKKL